MTPAQSAPDNDKDTRASSLKQADDAARQESATEDVNSPVKSCDQAMKSIIDVEIVGEDDEGLAGIALQLEKGDGKQIKGKTSAKGLFRFDRLDPGAFKLNFPELDKDAWELIETQPVSDKSSGDAVWSAGAPQPDAKGFVHRVLEGECVAALSERFGFFPITIWDRPENQALRETRDSLYVLAVDDDIFIPGRDPKPLDVNTATHYRIRRRGVPEVLKIRFLDQDENPREGVSYLCQIENSRGQTIKLRQGATDGEGMLIEPVPLDATLAHVTLSGDVAETYDFELGHLEPVDSVIGAQARLESLGYYEGARDGEHAELTRNALKRFQKDTDLEQTGDLDDATIDMLRGKYAP
ncbi:MAG: peptidoglycan-binding domain-containing protein [Sedimentitalea sp.]